MRSIYCFDEGVTINHELHVDRPEAIALEARNIVNYHDLEGDYFDYDLIYDDEDASQAAREVLSAYFTPDNEVWCPAMLSELCFALANDLERKAAKL